MEAARSQIDANSVLQELKRLCDRATTASSDDVDLLAIDLFASLVRQYEILIVSDATKIIADKFKSSNSEEILLALNILEECMSKCGRKFQNEIGKFRFLNELIRLVSPRYLGDKTPKRIRDKILDLMLLWTVNYPHETKIKDAYDMLLKQGVKHEFVKAPIPKVSELHDVKPLPDRPQPHPDIAEKLKKLLQSSKPCDHKAANLLIQNMVKEKERRLEMLMRRKIQIKEIIECASLLNEMLDQTDGNALSDDELTTLNDLHSSCRKLHPTMSIIVADLNEAEVLEEALEANDLLTNALSKYSKIMLRNSRDESHSTSHAATSSTVDNQALTNRNSLDELKDIFATSHVDSTMLASTMSTTVLQPKLVPLVAAVSNQIEPKNQSNLLTGDFLKDFNHITTPSTSLFDQITEIKAERKSAEPIKNGNDLMQKPASKLSNFDSDITALVSGLKINMNKEKMEEANDIDDDIMLDVEMTDEKTNDELEEIKVVMAEAEPVIEAKQESGEIQSSCPLNATPKSLSELFVDLNTIRPHDIHQPRSILDESNGLKITLNFTKDRPRDDVIVLVLTTINQNSLPVSNYQFEASVSKPCKIHLQKASGSELPALKPFRPPSEDITQLLLLANPERKPVKVMCIVSYTLANDPDPVKEFLEISDLPDLFND